MYPEEQYPRIRRIHTVCVYILKVYISFFLFSFLKLSIGNAWTKNDNGTTTHFLGSGRFPRRIGPNTHPKRGMANIAGFDPQMLCAWSDTGAACDPPKHSPLEPRSPRRLPLDNRGLQ
jgi:hypothetical protein